MAKYEKRLRGDFQAFLDYLVDGVLNGSASASFEDGSDWEASGVRCAVRVFERYSWTVGSGDELFLSAITSGGSQAMFWKMNTIGEESFLDCVAGLAEHYAGR